MKQIHQCDFALQGQKLIITKAGDNLVWKGHLYVPWFNPLLRAVSLQPE